MKGEKAKNIRRTARAHPKWTYRQIAEACDADISMVSRALKAAGKERSVFALGRVAREYGLTVQDLRALASRSEAA